MITINKKGVFMSKSKILNKQELRKNGYLTIEEFIKTIIPGLSEYLENNWSYTEKDALHHPEDLLTNASIYLDIACRTVGTFGVNPKKIIK